MLVGNYVEPAGVRPRRPRPSMPRRSRPAGSQQETSTRNPAAHGTALADEGLGFLGALVLVVSRRRAHGSGRSARRGRAAPRGRRVGTRSWRRSRVERPFGPGAGSRQVGGLPAREQGGAGRRGRGPRTSSGWRARLAGRAVGRAVFSAGPGSRGGCGRVRTSRRPSDRGEGHGSGWHAGMRESSVTRPSSSSLRIPQSARARAPDG